MATDLQNNQTTQNSTLLTYIEDVIEHLPADWLDLTTHRLDIYNEKLAKTEFLDEFETLYHNGNSDSTALNELPTAFDYIRLGHPLSSVLEWTIAKLNNVEPKQVISFSSRVKPILAVLRKNLIDKKHTQIAYTDELPASFDIDVLKNVYGYTFDLQKVSNVDEVTAFDGTTIFVSEQGSSGVFELPSNVDFYIYVNNDFGSIVLVNGEQNVPYVSEIQHVRRRETIAMTPANALEALKVIVGSPSGNKIDSVEANKAEVLDTIANVAGSDTKALIGSSGLSVQYAIMMGLIHDALDRHKGKEIKFIVPPNCYGGTNDQARRVAACIENVEILDLPVDAGNDMVQSIDTILDRVASEDAIPYIIAEIPTNPRVEVPDLQRLKEVLSKQRTTNTGEAAIDPVFILDQTFCPNVHFLGEGEILTTVKTIAYVSGSKFPSGGKCTAGYCVANKKAEYLMDSVEKHLQLCDNEATNFQIEILAEQMPSMLQRIDDAYKNTRELVTHIGKTLPEAKINFVSEELAEQGFTPSVFSLDLPTKGATEEEKEAYKRELNLKLINSMISEIPNESKFCVSYGQLKGCYWTIPATSTQGTTKEGDKDYIVRVSVSPKLDVEKHKDVFSEFVETI